MPLRFVPEPQIRDIIALHRRELMDELADMLPLAELEHVGSTAVPASWTSGVVDLQVRVSKEEFADAEKELAERFARAERLPGGDGVAGFRDDSRQATIRLTQKGGPGDVCHLHRDLLLDNPLLRERYDAIKRRHQKGDPQAYQADKAQFWAQAAIIQRP
jgi:GrpB-like predicted nucleotidyltransferase (UPF0157 family)